MKLGAVTPAYNEENLITGCIKCLEDFVDTHIVLVSERPYYGQAEELDKTAEIAESLGAEVIKGTWSLDHHQRNTGIALLQDCDWIICTDVDMWITKEDMQRLIKKLETTDSEAFIIAQQAYWKDIDHVLVNDDFKPVIAIRPNVKFTHIGCIDRQAEVIEDIKIHHINWCEPKNILKKVTTYSHAPEFNGELWYKTHYENWKDEKFAVLPNRTFEVDRQPLPDELRAYI